MMTTPPTTDMTPMPGWIMKQPMRKIGMKGMSNRAVGPRLARKPRIVSRSRIGCMLSPARALERHGGHEVEDAVGQELVEAGADARQHPSAEHVEAAGEGKGRKRDQRKADQGGDAPAGQHAVIDLEHVDGARERQNVDDRREYGDASKWGKQVFRASWTSVLSSRFLDACFISSFLGSPVARRHHGFRTIVQGYT